MVQVKMAHAEKRAEVGRRRLDASRMYLLPVV